MTEHSPDDLLDVQRRSRLITRALTEALAQVGSDLTPLETELLVILARRGATATSELVTATGLRPSTLTSALDRLHDRRAIVRQVRPEDRRSFLVMLTESGRDLATTAASALATSATIPTHDR